MMAIVIVLLFISGLFIWGGIDHLRDWRRIGRWDKVRARVLEKGAKPSEQPSRSKTASHEVSITYRYQIGRHSYTSSSYAVMHSLMPEKEARFKATQIPDEIQVYVNPENPEEVYYQTPRPWFGVLLLALGLVVLLVGWGVWSNG